MLENAKLAKYYDLLYSDLDYKKSSDEIVKIFSEYNKSNSNELLDVACGTGMHISYLKSKFNCVGTDISESMLKEARKKSLESVFKTGDMKNFKINKKFDTITCLFNSINYLKNNKELKHTLNNFYNHLKRGGILIVESLHKEDFENKFSHLRTYDGKNIKIARITKFIHKNNFVNANMHYMISEKGRKILKAEETLQIKLFSKEKILSLLKEVGFKVKYFKDLGVYECGLYFGIKS